MTWSPKARRFWPLFALVLLTDCATKRAAEFHLVPAQVPHEFLGEVVRLTLAYNPGAAMSLSLGAHSRVGFSLLALAALVVMAHLYRRTAPGDRQAAAGLALIAAGAAGNLIDRIRSARGVVDFIDVGFGNLRFWTFNIADVAILLGTVVLVLALRRMDTPPVSTP
ncbi:MAG TPA: signal peptidase II [Gemmatimonadales bacterium]